MYISTIHGLGNRWMRASASRPSRFIPYEVASATYCIGGWVNPRAGPRAVENRGTFPYREQDPSRPACNP
jgi:hypothetical protein